MFGGYNNFLYFCTRNSEMRALSSAGLERLPYKQRVGGSNPSAPTESLKGLPFGRSFSCLYTCDRKTFVR